MLVGGVGGVCMGYIKIMSFYDSVIQTYFFLHLKLTGETIVRLLGTLWLSGPTKPTG